MFLGCTVPRGVEIWCNDTCRHFLAVQCRVASRFGVTIRVGGDACFTWGMVGVLHRCAPVLMVDDIVMAENFVYGFALVSGHCVFAGVEAEGEGGKERQDAG